MVIGWDNGTTQTKLAYLDAAGKPSSIPNSRGDPVTPSAVYIPQSGEPLVGIDAIEQGVVDPDRLVTNFKLKLGSADSLLKKGAAVTPTDATAILIRTLKADAEKYLGEAVTEIVATCPANFRDDQKQALLDAFERNDIKVLRLVPEPTAAGIAYTVDKAASGALVAVFDFGGGTFDASILEKRGDSITVLATDGVPQLGGNDLNRVLEQQLDAAFHKQFGQPIPNDPLLRLDIAQRIEAAKISLNTQSTTPIVVGHGGRQVVHKFAQQEFQGAITPMVQQALQALDRTVRAAGKSYLQIDRLLLVGGTTRLAFIQKLAAEHTGLVPRTDIDPERTVAYGAALACGAELVRQGRTATLHGRAIPAPAIVVQDVTAYGIGCCVLDNQSGQRELRNALVIPENTPIPCARTECFFLEDIAQREAMVQILQGKANDLQSDCLLIGEFRLENLPPEPVRTQRIQIQYALDANGMVSATATDKVGGASKTISVDYKKGIARRQPPAAA